MYRDDGFWMCNDCPYKSAVKSHVSEHVEAKHIIHGGHKCQYCDKVLKTRNSLRGHMLSHKQSLWAY